MQRRRLPLPRSLALILVALAAALLIAACSDGVAPESPAPAPVGSADASHEADADGSSVAGPESEAPEPAPEPEVEPAPEPDPQPQPEPEPEPNPEAEFEPDPAPVTGPLPYDAGFALEVLRVLTVEIGPRARNTDGVDRAADYLSETFAALGYDVARQVFTLPFSGQASLTVTVDGEPLTAEPFAGSAGGDVTGPLVVVPGLGRPDDFAGIDVTGAVALIERGVLFFQDKIANAAAAGAAAVLIYNNEQGPFTGSLDAGSSIPAASLSREAGLALRDRAAATLSVRVNLEGGRIFVESENVIASSGTEDCRIYVGGHYDTVEDVAGANDNGSGTALVVELAQAFAGTPGVEAVCFVGFGAEEAVGGIGGIAGSAHLVKELQERGTVGQVIGMLNLDVAAVGNETVAIVGSPELTATTLAIAEAIGVPARRASLPGNTGSDHLNFQAVGIPVVFPTVFGGPIHDPVDTFEIVEPERLESVGQLAHATLQCLLVASGAPLTAPVGCDLAP